MSNLVTNLLSDEYKNSEYLSDLWSTVETGGSGSNEYLQLEEPTFQDMQKRGFIDKKDKFQDYITIKNGKRFIANPDKYKNLAIKFYEYMQSVYGAETPEEAALFAYRPGYLKTYGPNVNNIPAGRTGSFGKDSRTVMLQRYKHLKNAGFLK